jgi:hypothetical protein
MYEELPEWLDKFYLDHHMDSLYSIQPQKAKAGQVDYFFNPYILTA